MPHPITPSVMRLEAETRLARAHEPPDNRAAAPVALMKSRRESEDSGTAPDGLMIMIASNAERGAAPPATNLYTREKERIGSLARQANAGFFA